MTVDEALNHPFMKGFNKPKIEQTSDSIIEQFEFEKWNDFEAEDLRILFI